MYVCIISERDVSYDKASFPVFTTGRLEDHLGDLIWLLLYTHQACSV